MPIVRFGLKLFSFSSDCKTGSLLCSAGDYVDFCGHGHDISLMGSLNRIPFCFGKNNPCLRVDDEATVCKY